MAFLGGFSYTSTCLVLGDHPYAYNSIVEYDILGEKTTVSDQNSLSFVDCPFCTGGTITGYNSFRSRNCPLNCNKGVLPRTIRNLVKDEEDNLRDVTPIGQIKGVNIFYDSKSDYDGRADKICIQYYIQPLIANYDNSEEKYILEPNDTAIPFWLPLRRYKEEDEVIDSINGTYTAIAAGTKNIRLLDSSSYRWSTDEPTPAPTDS